MRPKLFLLFFIFFCSGSIAQIKPVTFRPSKPIGQSAIDQWTSDRGLVSNNLTSVLQARTGFLWITSYNGLHRFDGTKFEIFDKETIPFLSTDAFYRGYEDRNGNLWFATQGSGIMQYSNDEFKPFLPNDTLLPKSIRCLLFADNGKVWAGSNNKGLYSIQDTIVTQYPHSLVKDVSILSMAEDASHAVWIATNGNGLIKIMDDKVTQFTISDGLLSNVVNTVRSVGDEVFVGTPQGLNIVSGDKITAVGYTKGLTIISMVIDDFGSIWLATELGLMRINRKNDVYEMLTQEQGFPTLEITSLAFDSEGSLWLTTSKGGLVRLKDTNIITYGRINGLSSDLINTITEGPDGKMYVGSDLGAVDVLEDGKASNLMLKNSLKNISIRDICIDNKGVIWIGSYNGVLKKDGPREIVFNTANGLPKQDVRRVIQDKQGTMWFGTRSGGVIKFKNEKVDFVYHRKNGLSSNYILSLEEDPWGNIYAGTNGGGLSKIGVNDSVTTYHLTSDDSGILIFNIQIDADGSVWLVTNVGLFGFDGKSFTKIVLDKTVKGETYFDWVEDEMGNVWITSTRGIVQIRKSAVLEFLRKKLAAIKTRIYNNNDGMKSQECTAATKAIRSSIGEIWIPTIGGAAVVSPKQIQENKVVPPVYIMKIITERNEFKPVPPLSIAPGNLYYTFEFTCLSYLAPDRNQFRYRLEGFDDDWINGGTDREVRYTNLGPGEYNFKVIACNNDGVWNEQGMALAFTVQPFFYETKIFYSLVSLAILLLFFGIYKWRVQDIERRNRELKKVNIELDKFVYSASHDLRAPLSSVLGLVNVARMDHTAEQKVTYLDMMEKSIKKLDSFIKDIIDYSRNARVEVSSEEIHFEALIREVLSDLEYLDESNRILRMVTVHGSAIFYSDSKRLKIVLSNVISNAIKYHNLKKEHPVIEVRVEYDDQKAIIRIIDNGLGIAAEHIDRIFEMFYRATDSNKGSGLGLYIVKETVDKIQGTITVQSQFDLGTTFEVTIPSLKPKGLIKRYDSLKPRN
jgi:signal transduction histidine kinase/ligand-binding sensor domain-containing protein